MDTAKALFEDGFLNLNDSTIGKCVDDYEQRGFPYSTEYGLDFCKEHIVLNPRIRHVLGFYFGGRRCILGHWLRWKADPATECFMRGGTAAGRRALVIHLLPKGSQLRHYPGSHLRDLPTKACDRSTYAVEELDLKQACLAAQDAKFNDGGIVIRDARLSVKIVEGYTITFIFATDDLVATWPKMLLPNTDALKDRVAEMESPDIGVNFAFGREAESSA